MLYKLLNVLWLVVVFNVIFGMLVIDWVDCNYVFVEINYEVIVYENLIKFKE